MLKGKSRQSKFGNRSSSKASWLLTYSDMLTLLLVFFILLVGIRTELIAENKIRFILSVFNKNVGLLMGGHTLTDDEFHSMAASIDSLPSTYRKNQLEDARLKAHELMKVFIKSKRVRVDSNNRGLSISLLSDFFFKASSTEFNTLKNREILEKLKLFLHYLYINSGDYKIEIEGHADAKELGVFNNKAINKNSWELSFFRAQSIFRALEKVYLDNRNKEWGKGNISLHAYGDTQPISVVQTPEERALNRRVTIKCIWR